MIPSFSCPRRRSLAMLAALVTTSLALLGVTHYVPAQTTAKQAVAKVAAPVKRPLTHNDYNSWRSIQSPLLSPDGKYAAYTVESQEHDSQLVVTDLTKLADLKNSNQVIYNRGSAKGAKAGGAKGAKGGAADVPAVAGKVAFTEDSRRLVFTINPRKADSAKKADGAKKADSAKKGEKAMDAAQPSIGIMDLSTFKVKVIHGVRSFQLAENNPDKLIYLKAPPAPAAGEKKAEPAEEEDEDEEDLALPQAKGGKKGGGQKQGAAPARVTPSDLVVHNFDDGKENVIANVTDYIVPRDGRIVVCSIAPKEADEGGLFAYVIFVPSDQLPNLPLVKGKAKFSRFSWDEKQRFLSFYADHSANPKEPGPITLYLWDRDAKVREGDQAAVELLDSKTTAGLKDGCVLTDRAGISFSEDCSKLILGVAPPLPPPVDAEAAKGAAKEDKVVVELWHWKDDFIQPMQKARLQQEKNRTYTAVLHLKNKKLVQIADKKMPQATVTRDGNHAIGTDDHPYRDLVAFDQSYSDVYLVDTSDGKRKQVLKKQHGQVTLSPGGRFAIFFDGKDWNTISMKSGNITNITKKITETKFFNEEFDSPTMPPSYGILGWTRDEYYVLLYDKYDIWEVSTQGTSSRMLTKGFGKMGFAQFRYVKLDPKEKFVDPAKPMIVRFEMLTTRDSGFAIIEPGKQPALLTEVKKFSFGQPTKAKYADKLMLTIQSFANFPDLWVTDIYFKNVVRISDVNPEKNNFNWGEAVLVKYKSADGVPLSGILIKPENFNKDRKYPMIVYIYERLSQNLHHFVVPKEGTSINPTFYASNGYLVFMPDIAYTIGYPGQSALKCVMPGIQAVVEMGSVDENAIGIQGHSWGGYQIAYMITQTNRFKAAAAGAAVSNMTSAYDGIRWGTGLPRQFQYEKTQSRIGGSLWEYPMRFVENSPVFMADRVKTPLLLLHNDQDDAVPWYQGIEYYLALRRLGKEVYLFNYPGELHGLRKKENQKDYTIRMQQFFDHHLRGMEAPEWMTHGIPYARAGMRGIKGRNTSRRRIRSRIKLSRSGGRCRGVNPAEVEATGADQKKRKIRRRIKSRRRIRSRIKIKSRIRWAGIAPALSLALALNPLLTLTLHPTLTLLWMRRRLGQGPVAGGHEGGLRAFTLCGWGRGKAFVSNSGSSPGVGTQAVLPPNSMRPIAGLWAAVEKNGTVYVHYMHNQASTMANGGVFGPVDRTGFVKLDSAGKVVSATWDVP